jgi:hypothetical protein
VVDNKKGTTCYPLWPPLAQRFDLRTVTSVRFPSLVWSDIAMSSGYSVGDFVLLATLAHKTVQIARGACGAHDSLTRDVGSLHVVLARL